MPKRRIIVIGDIHGAFRALEPLVDRLSLQKEDVLIFLGDYVDGWSESRSVIDFLIDFGQTHDCIFLKGNHDAWCAEWLEGGYPDPSWLLHGGLATIDSYKGIPPRKLWKHLTFFRQLLPFYVDTSNRLFVHAGFTSQNGPGGEHFMSTLTWDRTLWETALAVDERLPEDSPRYPKRLLLFKEIFLGHTPTTNYDITVPMHACNVWNVDTGAAFKGKLTSMDVETKDFRQSEIVQTLYPLEKGRNVL